ncbi:MAG: cytochrome P450 [Dehalococcoidia bacterium]
MRPLPHDRSPDSTLALVFDGYEFISKRCEHYQSNAFQARLLLRPHICMRGAEAASVFYDPERFERQDAAPARVKKTLFGEGGVQGMDGDAHRHRKEMFMSLMTPEGVQRLADLTAQHWTAAMDRWEQQEKVALLPAVEEILTRAVCEWAGVPLEESEVGQRAREFTAMIDSPGAIGLRHWQGRRARSRNEAWVRGIISYTRATGADGTALAAIALHRDTDGDLLDEQVAAVELINVLRPTVAIARYITFAALALHEHPEFRPALTDGGAAEAERFVQEVRRFYPFFPFVAARVRREFDWQGYRFPQGTRTLLDLYGTNHDPRSWDDPEAFRPDRFRDWDGSAFNFIPQGGGDHYLQHRCPGEWITIAVLKAAVDMLTRRMRYDVPEQDLRVPLSKMPTAPKSGFVIANVRRAP